MEKFTEKNNSLIITDIESFLPDKKITNIDLERQLPETYPPQDASSEDRIYQKVGIKERRTVVDDMTSTDMAGYALKKLLDKDPVLKDEKIMLAVGTVLNEDRYPSVAAKLMERLGITMEHGYHFENSGFDIGAACSGWTYGVHTAAAQLLARGYLAESPYDKVFVVTADTVTRILKRHDADTRILFGDAATASVIKHEQEGMTGFKILRTSISTIAKDTEKSKDTDDVSMPTELSLKAKGKDINSMVMNGKKVYVHGREYTSNFFLEYCKKYNISPDEIDYFIPHQSNQKMLDSMNENFLKLGKNKYGEEKMLSNIEMVGNTVASSTPLCLFDFWKKGHFKNGDRVLLCSFGAGYTLGIVDLECKF